MTCAESRDSERDKKNTERARAVIPLFSFFFGYSIYITAACSGNYRRLIFDFVFVFAETQIIDAAVLKLEPLIDNTRDFGVGTYCEQQQRSRADQID
jgi:hypothetical protein